MWGLCCSFSERVLGFATYRGGEILCGIAGVFGHDQDLTNIERMTATMVHRGPDDSGTWRSSVFPIALGHRRLSIIDLSAAGAQPMIDSERGLALVYNGELYNAGALQKRLAGLGHAFAGHSDTEVVLRAYQKWGSACLAELSGMFAFAIVDEKQGELLLARDRCGQKPLYYSVAGGGFAFASEVKALLELTHHPRRIDPVALEEYLAYGHTLGPRTMIEGVSKIAPGQFMRMDLASGERCFERFWELESSSVDPRPMEVLLEELEVELEAAVCRHLVSDVPVGVLLSGGIDSSLVSAMVARVDRSVKTFSVSFPGGGRFDEAAHARAVAEHLGLNHVEVEIDGFGPEILMDLAEAFDDPLADHAIVPTYLLSRRIREEVKVALGGDGGDELFGGYPHARIVEHQARLRWVPSGVRGAIANASTSILPPGTPGRNHLIGLAGDVNWAVAHINLYFDPKWRAKLVPILGSKQPEEGKRSSVLGVEGAIQKCLVSDFQTTMAEGFLTKIDRASMLASLELRAPFLDDRLIEFAWAKVPVTLKVNRAETKILLRRLASRLLPESIASRTKQGFTMPLDDWMGSGWGTFFRDVLLDPSQKIFEHDAVASLFEYQRRGFRNAARIFSLVMFALWVRRYSITSSW